MRYIYTIIILKFTCGNDLSCKIFAVFYVNYFKRQINRVDVVIIIQENLRNIDHIKHRKIVQTRPHKTIGVKE